MKHRAAAASASRCGHNACQRNLVGNGMRRGSIVAVALQPLIVEWLRFGGPGFFWVFLFQMQLLSTTKCKWVIACAQSVDCNSWGWSFAAGCHPSKELQDNMLSFAGAADCGCRRQLGHSGTLRASASLSPVSQLSRLYTVRRALAHTHRVKMCCLLCAGPSAIERQAASRHRAVLCPGTGRHPRSAGRVPVSAGAGRWQCVVQCSLWVPRVQAQKGTGRVRPAC